MSHLPQETSSSLVKKYAPQVQQLKEIYPDWTDDDLSSLLNETHGSVELAYDRISQGQAQQWGAVSRKHKKPPPAARESSRPHSGRGQRGRGTTRGGHRGSSSHRGSQSRQQPATTNGTGSEVTVLQSADVSDAPPAPAPVPTQPVHSELKANGHSVPEATHPIVHHDHPTNHAPVASPSAAPPSAPKSWASLLKPKPSPIPTPAKPPLTAPSQISASTAPAPPATQIVTVEHQPDPFQAQTVSDIASDSKDSYAELDTQPESRVDQPPDPAPEPVVETAPPVHEQIPPAQEEPKIEQPPPAVSQSISSPVPTPPHHAPPGLNLVTQQAPAPEAAPTAVRQSPAVSAAQKHPVQHRPSARYPKSDQAVVLPSRINDLVTGMGGLSFGQFGDSEPSADEAQKPVESSLPPGPVHQPPVHQPPVGLAGVPTSSQPAVPAQSQDITGAPLHLVISDQLPQAQETRPPATQNHSSQPPLLSHLPQPVQQQPQTLQSHFSPPGQAQTTAQSHFPAQIQAHLPQHPSVTSNQSPHLLNAQQQQHQQDSQLLHSSHLSHTQVHEPFPQHALGGGNLYHQSSQSPFGQQPQQQPQPLHSGLRQTHLPQQQQQISAPGPQNQQPMIGAGLGTHYQQPHLELGVGSEYGAFGNLGQQAGANFGTGPERYGYENSHSHQSGFYDPPYGVPSRGASNSEEMAKGSPNQQQSAPLSQNAAPSQSQPQQQQQPNQPGQQQPYSGIAPMPYYYAPYYQNQYFGQPSPNYGQQFVKYAGMYPQQSQQQSQQQPQQNQGQPQQQAPQTKPTGSLYDDQYGQGGYQPQGPQSAGSEYGKGQPQQFGVQGGQLHSLLGGQGRGSVTSDVGLKNYGSGTDKPRVGQQQAPYYGGSMRYPQHVPHQQGYQQQPDNGYYSYGGRQPQQPSQNYGQWS